MVTIFSACEEDDTATPTEAGWLYTEPKTLEEFSGALDISIDDSGHVSAYPNDSRSLRFFVIIDKIVGESPRDIEWQKIQLIIDPEKLQLTYAISLRSVEFQLDDLSVAIGNSWAQTVEPENIKILRTVFRPGVKAILTYQREEKVDEKVVELTTREVEAIQTVIDFYEFWTA